MNKPKSIEVTTNTIILTYNDRKEIIDNNKAGKMYVDAITSENFKMIIEESLTGDTYSAANIGKYQDKH